MRLKRHESLARGHHDVAGSSLAASLSLSPRASPSLPAPDPVVSPSGEQRMANLRRVRAACVANWLLI